MHIDIIAQGLLIDKIDGEINRYVQAGTYRRTVVTFRANRDAETRL